MCSGDLLGEIGRKYLDGCVLILVIERPIQRKKKWLSGHDDSLQSLRAGARQHTFSNDLETEYSGSQPLPLIANTDLDEVKHGSGFFVHDHFVVTCGHVIKKALDGHTQVRDIYISNAVIGKLPSLVAHIDMQHDLALLYCERLNTLHNGIPLLPLSNHSLVPGMEIFSFGYPRSYKGDRALFSKGIVKELRDKQEILITCTLNTGNSGGPVLCWYQHKLVVIGVALVEESPYPDYRKTTKESPQNETSVALSTLLDKLYISLETHSFHETNSLLPASVVIGFIQDSVTEYNGEFREELREIVRWSKLGL